MSVNTTPVPDPGQPGPDTLDPALDLPPELRHDGAGSRALDVVIAIRAAHHVGAFATEVTSQACGGHRSLAARLHASRDGDEYASAAQADAVLRAFEIPFHAVRRTEALEAAAWWHWGITEDGLRVHVLALGPIEVAA